jgi:predicted RecA/RadA family phage recombinase
MPEASFVQARSPLDYTPAGATAAGAVVLLPNGMAGVVSTGLAASQLGAIQTEGVFDFTAATGVTFAADEAVYWDASANTAINVANLGSGDFLLGYATAAKVSGQLFVRVNLNAASKARQHKTISTATTLDVSDLDSTIFVNTQAAAVTVTLPPSASCVGRRLTFIRAGTGVNAITLDGNASETIDGIATYAAMDAIRDTVTIESDGANWFIVAIRVV